jgi:hypothetical protein
VFAICLLPSLTHSTVLSLSTPCVPAFCVPASAAGRGQARGGEPLAAGAEGTARHRQAQERAGAHPPRAGRNVRTTLTTCVVQTETCSLRPKKRYHNNPINLYRASSTRTTPGRSRRRRTMNARLRSARRLMSWLQRRPRRQLQRRSRRYLQPN